MEKTSQLAISDGTLWQLEGVFGLGLDECSQETIAELETGSRAGSTIDRDSRVPLLGNGEDDDPSKESRIAGVARFHTSSGWVPTGSPDAYGAVDGPLVQSSDS